jgi:hypothetical protein
VRNWVCIWSLCVTISGTVGCVSSSSKPDSDNVAILGTGVLPVRLGMKLFEVERLVDDLKSHGHGEYSSPALSICIFVDDKERVDGIQAILVPSGTYSEWDGFSGSFRLGDGQLVNAKSLSKDMVFDSFGSVSESFDWSLQKPDDNRRAAMHSWSAWTKSGKSSEVIRSSKSTALHYPELGLSMHFFDGILTDFQLHRGTIGKAVGSK